ncbi:MAG TPA: xylulokinase [Stellaceae bacterium]|nr:xylulokinase [Stellaceae bacterium]
MYLGIDLGTSALKAVLVDEEQHRLAEASVPLSVQRPRALWSEQAPAAWWRALRLTVAQLRTAQPGSWPGIRSIGLAGQMHGAVLLDNRHRVLRPCILWNDNRAAEECLELEEREPEAQNITANLVMPGFTAPKLRWVARHEPDIFDATKTVLLPKDYLRLRLTGTRATDLSDAAGTCWLDVKARVWSERMLQATGLSATAMPELFEGNEPTGTLLPAVADDWGLSRTVVVAAGGGDNAAAAVGLGAIEPGTGFLSVGTSGVLFETDAYLRSAPERAVHAFCHCLPLRWHRMAVTLSAASSLSWLKLATHARDEGILEAEAVCAGPSDLMFLPHLSGERTPYNDPHATAAFVGLAHRVGRGELARAVMEGVALGLADAAAAMGVGKSTTVPLPIVGGGAKSRLWISMIASALNRPLALIVEASGPAVGAARLARLAHTGERPDEVCTPPQIAEIIEPNEQLVDELAGKLEKLRRLYLTLRQFR